MKRIPLACAFSLVAIIACTGNRSPSRVQRDLSVITQEEMLDQHFQSAYDAVEAIHSNWLHAHGPDSFIRPSEVLVYFDNILLGGVQTLRAISVRSIVFVKHYDSLAATQRWGVGHNAGVIYVSAHPMSEFDR